MSSIKLTGDTSGEITISAPAVAGTNTLTLPASTGTIITDDGSGNLTIDGTTTATGSITSTGGIYLGGTASANLLDDYEEGTFTPTLITTGTTPTITYTQQQGNYIKIGQLVFCEFSIQGSAYSGGSGNLRVGGFPFSAAPNWAGTLTSGYNFNIANSIIGYMESNSAFANLTNFSTSNGADYIAYSDVTAPFHMIATVTFRTLD